MKYKTPTQIIEDAYQKSGRGETNWVKIPGIPEMVDVTKISLGNFCSQDREKLQSYMDRVGAKTYRDHHPHICERLYPGLISTFNQDDLICLLADNQQRTSVAIQQNKTTGKVERFYVLKKTKRTPRSDVKPKNQEARKDLLKRSSFLRGVLANSSDWESSKNSMHICGSIEEVDACFDKLLDQYGLRFRAVPAPGFELQNSQDGIKFVKKRNLEAVAA